MNQFSSNGFTITASGLPNGNIITGSSYIVKSSDGIQETIQKLSNDVHSVTMLSRTTLFALACIVLGMDTIELRYQFRVSFDKIDSTWGDDWTYTYLIQEAYRIKYGYEQVV